MKRILKKLLFPVIGLLSLIWFLFRVIPKPSRVTYPCMRATAPVASSFVIYLLGLLSSILFLKRARKYLFEARYILFTVSILLGLILGFAAYLHTDKKVYANYQTALEGPNQPMGVGKGVNPGRVVWVYDPDATDNSCKNKSGDYWWQDDNTNQEVVNSMVSDALRMLTGAESDAAAWDVLFRYYNQTHGKGDVGYKAGEKIVIKINLNTGCTGSNNSRNNLQTLDTSPHIVYAVLNQLVNIAGVEQENIGFGDPGRNVDNLFWNKCHPDFPNVKYWGEGSGRTPIVRSNDFEIFTSDGQVQDWLPTCYLEAAYMINIPVLKQHHSAGVSLTSKNHFGTIVPFNESAAHWHYSLPCTQGKGDVDNGGYAKYRCFVDIMGHKHLGDKTILYLIDGIWSSTNYGDPPWKWRMAPFNNDWPSSIFVSQDPVAIESVGFDFLYEEFYVGNPSGNDFPHYSGVDDFLHQAADSLNRPKTITYDPENDGTPITGSLGTHEHWNNAVDKKYSKNLGAENGIELVTNYNPTGINDETNNSTRTVKNFILYQNYPNPCNSSTTIWYRLSALSRVKLIVYTTTGQNIRTIVDEYQDSGSYKQKWDGLMDNGFQAPSGIYFYEIIAQNNDQYFRQVKKMVLVK